MFARHISGDHLLYPFQSRLSVGIGRSLRGELQGRIAQGRGQVSQSACVLSFKAGKDGLTVGTNQTDQCQESCGMRAAFVGEYIRPAPLKRA